MSRRNQAQKDRRMRLWLWGGIVIFILLIGFCAHPFVWKTEAQFIGGSPISLNATSDFLIVVDTEALESHPKSFREMSFSHGWLNTLQQEIGPVSHVNAQEFQDIELKDYRCVILTRSVSEQESWVPKIRSFLERGGTVIMEMPGVALRSLGSADGKGGIRDAQSLTYATGLDSEYLEALSGLNFSAMTELMGSAGPLENAQTWMTIDGVPVVYSKPYATGHVITVDFDYGMLITALQQGRPLDDFGIRNLRDTSRIETSDLSFDVTQKQPHADMIERFLMYGVLDNIMPVVGFWPFFDGMDGALIVSHRENYAGDASLWMPHYESTFKATSTFFASSPLQLSDEGLDKVHQYNTELGLHVDILPSEASRAREPIGIFVFSPVWRQLNVQEQAESLKEKMGEKRPLLSSQSRGGIWLSHYTRTFGLLSAAGFRADASYRSPYDAPGYAFGTGMPFMPVDTNGLVFNLLEFPVIFPELTTEEDAKMLATFLQNSETSHHQAIGVSFAPSDLVEMPNAEAFLAWKEAYELASKHKHWITSILNYFRFSRARFNAELKTRVSEMQINNKRVSVLRLETLAPETGMSVTVPAKLKGKSFTEARRGVQRVREDSVLSDTIQSRQVSLFGFERMIIPISKGFNAIDVIYE